MSGQAVDEELAAGRRRADWRHIVLWTVLALLALLVVMTLIGLVAGVHASGGVPHRPPAPAPAVPPDMPH